MRRWVGLALILIGVGLVLSGLSALGAH